VREALWGAAVTAVAITAVLGPPGSVRAVAADPLPAMVLEVRPPVGGPGGPTFPIVVTVKGKGDIYFDEKGIGVSVEELSGHFPPYDCIDKRSFDAPKRSYVRLRHGESKVYYQPFPRSPPRLIAARQETSERPCPAGRVRTRPAPVESTRVR